MSGPEPEALEKWAAAHSLAWQPEDTLPPATERLKLGVGVGEHRAGMRYVTDKGLTITEGQKKRPERQTLGVCKGHLPGGLEGRLGHHVYLSDKGRGTEDRYIATTDTVVYSEVPFRGRPAFHLKGVPGGPADVKVMATIGKNPHVIEDPVAGVIPAPQGSTESGGMIWTSFPAESDERVRRIVSAATRALDGLPVDRVMVEYECGKLAVWVRGRALTVPAELDSLCRFASGIAAGLADVDGSASGLPLNEALPLPEPDLRTAWTEAGADLVEWDRPPVSVLAAQERYKEEVKSKATRTGWKVYGIVGVGVFVIFLILAAIGLASALVLDQIPLGLGVVGAVVFLAFGAIAANRVALEVGQETLDGRVQASAVPWGLEAFARGYAEHSGLTREDHEELRHRVAVPFDGRAQMAWQGELAPGSPGHLSVWIDATDNPEPPRFYVLAITAPNGAEAPPGHQVLERDGHRLTWQEVESGQRATHRLDGLRDAVTS